eukprot:3048679-Prymnesium_polylepis.1
MLVAAPHAIRSGGATDRPPQGMGGLTALLSGIVSDGSRGGQLLLFGHNRCDELGTPFGPFCTCVGQPSGA